MESTRLFLIACLVALLCLITGTESQFGFTRSASQERQFKKDRSFMLEAYKEKLERLIENAENMKSEAPSSSSHRLIQAYQDKIDSLKTRPDSPNAHEKTSDPDNHLLNHIFLLKEENRALRRNQERHWLSEERANRDQSQNVAPDLANQKIPQQLVQPSNYIVRQQNPVQKIPQVPVESTKIEKPVRDPSQEVDTQEPLLGSNSEPEPDQTEHNVAEIKTTLDDQDEQDAEPDEKKPRLIKLHKKGKDYIIVKKNNLASELTEDKEEQAVAEDETETQPETKDITKEQEVQEEQSSVELEGATEKKDKISTSDTIVLTVAAVAVVCAIVFIVFTTIQWRRTMKVIKVDQIRSRQSLQAIRDEIVRLSGSTIGSNSIHAHIFDETEDKFDGHNHEIIEKPSSPRAQRDSIIPPHIPATAPAKPPRSNLSHEPHHYKGHITGAHITILDKQHSCSSISSSGESGGGRF